MRQPSHRHDWQLVSKEFVEGTPDGASLERGSEEMFRQMLQMHQGYWSYVFHCACGEVKIERS